MWAKTVTTVHSTRKYHQVPDGLEDLKSQFSFLKEATSRNVENLLQAIVVQQTYTTNLCGHVNVILSRLTKLENDIQKLTKKSQWSKTWCK